MPKINIEKLSAEAATGYPEPFKKAVEGRSRKRLGAAAGLTQFGVNLCTLKPGAASSQNHWHDHEDEFIYMLEGEAVLCEDGNEIVLKPGDVAAWKAGVPDGHNLVNRSSRDVVFLEIGSRAPTERVLYPGVDLVFERDAKGSRYTNRSGVPY